MKRWLISVCVFVRVAIFSERKSICMQAPAQVRTPTFAWTLTQEQETAGYSNRWWNFSQLPSQFAKFSHCACVLFIKVEKDKRVRGRRETDGCQKTSQSWKAEALRSCIFRCNLREDIFFLSGAPGKDELHRNLYNDCHWWQKPSPPNLLAAYGSTDEPFSLTATVSALQSDSRDSAAQQHTCRNLHTHSHSKCSPGQAHKQALFLSSKNTITHTQSCLQSPKATHNKKTQSQLPSSSPQTRESERESHTHETPGC